MLSVDFVIVAISMFDFWRFGRDIFKDYNWVRVCSSDLFYF